MTEEIKNNEVTAQVSRLCYLCGALLDADKACTDPECILCGTPQE